MPRVEPASFLTLHYRLAGPQGDVINTFAGRPATLSLGAGELAPAVEQRLLGLEEGARAVFEIPAGEAYGERNPDFLQWLARKDLNELGDPDEPTVGPHADAAALARVEHPFEDPLDLRRGREVAPAQAALGTPGVQVPDRVRVLRARLPKDELGSPGIVDPRGETRRPRPRTSDEGGCCVCVRHDRSSPADPVPQPIGTAVASTSILG